MTIDAPKRLPPRNLLPLATTVERVYSETPTWLLAVGLAIAAVAVLALGCAKQVKLDNYQQCIVDHGAADARCVALNK
jgi:anti-sigma-K factor RskA